MDSNIFIYAVGCPHPSGLTARDLVHLAVCHQHKVTELKTSDRNLQSAFAKG